MGGGGQLGSQGDTASKQGRLCRKGTRLVPSTQVPAVPDGGGSPAQPANHLTARRSRAWSQLCTATGRRLVAEGNLPAQLGLLTGPWLTLRSHIAPGRVS